MEKRISEAHPNVAATASPYATDAAIEILRDGGNAIDAAAAAAWALSVCEPSGSGLGGQTSLLVHLADGSTEVVDGSSRAPAGVRRRLIKGVDQRRGYRSCTIPSMPATLGFIQERYGRLTLSRVMEPAIALAEEGYEISRLQRRQVRWCLPSLSASPAASRLFLVKGKPPRRGSVFRQKELAAVLQRLAEHGVEDFYRGQIARDIAEDMRLHGGLMTEDDLAELEPPVVRKPLTIRYRGRTVASSPPPGGGLHVLLGLKVLEKLAPSGFDGAGGDWYVTMAEVVSEIFRERDRWPVKPGDITPSLRRWLLGDERAEEIAEAIRLRLSEPEAFTGPEEPGDTTHLCTADAEGNVVSLTQSIQSLYGAKVASAKLGFVYNNSLCTCPRHRHPNQLRSRCVPRSNAAPTIVFDEAGSERESDGGAAGNRTPVLALGAAGSRRITSSILQVISRIFDERLPLGEAVSAPRVHGLLSRKVEIERSAITEELNEALEASFRALRLRAPRSYSMGALQAIARGTDGGWTGAADPRRDGTAAGA